MSAVEKLPADQRAVISLLVGQGRSYSELSSLLAIDESAVRERAHQALSAMAGSRPDGLDPAGAGLVGDYMLGQLTEAERIETLALLFDSLPSRIWARKVASGLGPVATKPLPQVPDDLPGGGVVIPAPEPKAAPERAVPRAPRPRRSPALDLGGRVLAAAAVLVVAAIVVFVVRSGGSSSPARGPIAASVAKSSGASGSSASVVNRFALKPTSSSSKASGAVEVIKNGSTLELAFSAANLPSPGSGHYVLWMYNSPTQYEALGVVRSVSNGSVGPLGVTLPSNASSYSGVALALTTSNTAKSPGSVVLTGTSSSPL